MVFETIIGNDNIKNEMKKSIKLGKISHSYLFIGIDGIGKKLFAKDFSKTMLCKEKENFCNSCKSCIEFNSGNHPDFEIIEPDGSSVKINQIRQMQKKIWESPIISERKIYIINNADLMTTEAQNCLLKTLEEPPSFVNVILIGSNEEMFLNTIKSRCTIIKFKGISDENIKKHFKEKNDINEDLIIFFEGSIGKAERVLEKQNLFENLFEIIENIQQMDLIDFLKKAELIYKSQEEKKEILDGINVLLLKKSKENIRFLKCIDIVEETKKRLKYNGNYNICIDNMLFNMWEEMH